MTRAARAIPFLVALLCACLTQAVWDAPNASAQVAVLRVDPGAEPLCAAFESALAGAPLVRDPGYLAEANAQNMNPVSEAALELITPLLGLQLAVVPLSADQRAVQVEFRDGQSGASLGTVAIPLDDGWLGTFGRAALRSEVSQRLGVPLAGAGAGAGARPSGPSDGDGDITEEPAATDTPGMIVQLFAGLGVGTRDVEWPKDGEQRVVETGAFAAFEVAADLALPLSGTVALGSRLEYQSSLAHAITESHTSAPDETWDVRAHRFAALLVAAFKFGADRTFSLAPGIGYGARNLRPEVHHLLTPSYSLTGPLARLSVRIAFGDTVALRLAPEAQWLLVGEALRDEGVEATGVALGGEAALALDLSRAFAVELTFRQANALLSAREGDASDVERFVTARLGWTP
jgi:hypothetical protein